MEERGHLAFHPADHAVDDGIPLELGEHAQHLHQGDHRGRLSHPVVDRDTFDEAPCILAQRGEDHTRRAANSSDNQLTGLMRCPQCGKAMIGTRAHGKNKVYRYYTCVNRSR